MLRTATVMKKQKVARNVKASKIVPLKEMKCVNRRLKNTGIKAYYKRKKRLKSYNSDDDEDGKVILSNGEKRMEEERVSSGIEDNEPIPYYPCERNSWDSDNETGRGLDTGKKYSKGNEGWADVMTKILNRRLDSKRTTILAKAITDQEIARKKEHEKIKEQGFEIDSASVSPVATYCMKTWDARRKSVKQMKKDLRTKELEKKSWENMGRLKPNVLCREKERALQQIATTGVVQLFNAVREREKAITVKLNEAGGSKVKREFILKSMTKGDFLDVLKQKARSIPLKDAITTEKKNTAQPNRRKKPTWHVFSDEFMMGAKMNDWDKEADAN